MLLCFGWGKAPVPTRRRAVTSTWAGYAESTWPGETFWKSRLPRTPELS